MARARLRPGGGPLSLQRMDLKGCGDSVEMRSNDHRMESWPSSAGAAVARYPTGRARTTQAHGKLTDMTPQASQHERIAKMSFATVYPLYVNKVEKKGRTEEELLRVLRWLTGFTKAAWSASVPSGASFPNAATRSRSTCLSTGFLSSPMSYALIQQRRRRS